MQAVGESVWPRSPGIPGTPTNVQASAGNAQATVSFNAPDNGGFTITSYVVTSSPGNITASGASSPITITGLTNDTTYTFTVYAVNAIGNGLASNPSNSVTPIANVIGEVTYSTPGTYSWTAPAGVESVCVVCVGNVYYTSAGDLSWKNNIPVTPGQSYTLFLANTHSYNVASYFKAVDVVSAYNSATGTVGARQGGGKGAGGGQGGGGASGYTGDGGSAGQIGSSGSSGNGGGGGGGGGTSYLWEYYPIGSDGVGWGYRYSNGSGGGGGGVGLLGQGSSGSGGFTYGSNGSTDQYGGSGGNGGSGGVGGGSALYPWAVSSSGSGGDYGGGCGTPASAGYYNAAPISGYNHSYGAVGKGAIRIIWGNGRAFPSTNTGVL
jgi:hypothetical protein